MPTAMLSPEVRAHWIDRDGHIAFWKDEDSVLDYQLDWTYLLDGDTISTSTWAVDDGDVVVNSSSSTTTSTTAWVANTSGVLINTVVTAGGRTHIRRVRFYQRET